MAPVVIDFTAFINGLQIPAIVTGIMMLGTAVGAIYLVVMAFKRFFSFIR
jgi:hypothetical protein